MSGSVEQMTSDAHLFFMTHIPFVHPFIVPSFITPETLHFGCEKVATLSGVFAVIHSKDNHPLGRRHEKSQEQELGSVGKKKGPAFRQGLFALWFMLFGAQL